MDVFGRNATYINKCFRYLHKINSIVFIVSAIKQAKFHLSGTIITEISLLGYIYFAHEARFQQRASPEK